MPIFSFTDKDGKPYKLDAPDQKSAIAMFKRAQGPKLPEQGFGSGVMDQFTQGLGIGDEISAFENAALGRPSGGGTFELFKYGDTSFKDRYKEALATERGQQARFKKKHPVLSAVAQTGGILAPAFISGGTSLLARGGLTAANVAKSAGVGAAVGGGVALVQGMGEATGGVRKRFDEALPQVPMGAGFGALGGAVSPFASRWIEKLAARRATKKLANAQKSLSHQKVVQAADDIGVPVHLGMATDNTAIQVIGRNLGDTVFGRPLKRALDATDTGLDKAADKAFRGYGTVPDSFLAGQTQQAGIRGGIERIKDMNDRLFARVRDLVPSQAKGDPVSFAATHAEISARQTAAGILPGTLGRVDLAEIPAARSLDGMREVRNEIGRVMAGLSDSKGYARGDLKQLYGALSRDMETLAVTHGGDKALQAMRTANAHFRTSRERIRNALEPFLQSRGGVDVAPEQAFTRLYSMTAGKNGGLQGLRQIRTALKPDEWDEIVSGVLGRMGAPRAGVAVDDSAFSAATFVTNYGKLEPKAKVTLFASKPALKKALDDLFIVTSARKKLDRQYNASRTGATMTNYLSGAALITDPFTATLGAIGANRAAKLMSSPTFVRWLAGGLKMARGGKQRARLAREKTLLRIANAERALAEPVQVYISALRAGYGAGAVGPSEWGTAP